MYRQGIFEVCYMVFFLFFFLFFFFMYLFYMYLFTYG